MMAPSHAATGALAGLASTAATAPLTGMRLDGWVLATGALIGAGAALLPDLDHPGSTAARSQGPLTALASRGVQALSAQVYRLTRTPGDKRSEGTHRYLFHTPACALVLGVVAGVAATLWTAAMAVLVWFTLSLALRGLGQALPGGRARTAVTSWVALSATVRRILRPLPARVRRHVAEWTSVSATAGALTLVLVKLEAAHTGPYIGVSLALGMIVHSLGDALTHSAVPLAWPFTVGGQRWAMLGPPRRWRFATGAWQEKVICVGCLVATPGLGVLLA